MFARSFKSFSIFVLVSLTSIGVTAHLSAGTIILSGDINPLDALPGGFSIPNAGNSVFFSNIIGRGTSVLIHGLGQGRAAFLNNYYDSQPGVNSSLLSGAITSGGLSGVNLFVSILPTVPYTPEELSVLGLYLSGGGTVMFLGENATFGVQNGYVSAALATLGSSMSLGNPLIFDTGPQIVTGDQIAANPLTAGISSFSYGAPSQVNVGSATVLFFGKAGEPFMAVEGLTVSTSASDSGSTVSLFSLGLTLLGWCGRRWRIRRAVT